MVKKVGQWNLAGLVTRRLKPEIEQSNKVVLKNIGLKAEALMVRYIMSQPSVWPPLSPKYKRRKKARGFSNLMGVRTSTMVNAITSHLEGTTVSAGVKRTAFTPDGEQSSNIAAVFVFGSKKRNIPPRDFLSPVLKHMRRKIIHERLFSRILLARLRNKYGVR